MIRLMGSTAKLWLLVISPLLLACPSKQRLSELPPSTPIKKIDFDISRISPEGLVGPSDGLTAVSYEFCIPASERHLAEVQAIAPTLQHYSRARGRIGCNNDQFLCIGSTHNPQWREILFAIARLDYVKRIVQSFGE